MTALDRAGAAMAAAPDDEAAARAFYARLAAAELFLLLEAEPEGDSLRPRLFPLEDGPVALAFDTEERLADFAGAAPYAALSGRALAAMLSGRGIGLGLNIGTSGAEQLLPADALDWLAEQGTAAAIIRDMPEAFGPPGDLPEALLPEIEARLAILGGLAQRAILATAYYPGGDRRPVLVLLDPIPGSEDALAAAISEAIAIAGAAPDSVDVAFLSADHPAAERLLRTGLAIDLPAPPAPEVPAAPGSDPAQPPKLRSPRG